MSDRAARLLALIDHLRRARRPVTAADLAFKHDVSLRTLYRDIASLREQGADIEGDPGVGYRLKPGFLLPPLMFDTDELEALVLGARWVEAQADSQLSQAASTALARISAPCQRRCASPSIPAGYSSHAGMKTKRLSRGCRCCAMQFATSANCG